MKPVVVWDLPTRAFHWSLVALLIVTWFSGEDEGWVFALHTFTGYALFLLVLFRLMWGLIGSRHSRFGDFVHPWSKVRSYVGRLLSLSPPRHVGHNPLGGWMILLLLATVLGVALTGMAAGAPLGAPGILPAGVPRALAEIMEEIHEGLANFLILLAVVHVIGVLAGWLFTGENLIRAMITGDKQLDEAAAADEPAPVGLWRAVPLLLLLVLLGYYMLGHTNLRQGGEREDSHRWPTPTVMQATDLSGERRAWPLTS
jgi:cytochrome b